MLFMRGTGSEVSIVGKIHENLRAVARELAYQVRERGFVTDEGAYVVGKNDYAIASCEIARLFRDAVYPRENVGNKFAERDEFDFVVLIDRMTGWVDHYGGVERGSFFRMADRTE